MKCTGKTRNGKSEYTNLHSGRKATDAFRFVPVEELNVSPLLHYSTDAVYRTAVSRFANSVGLGESGQAAVTLQICTRLCEVAR
jgi:hypothetical protein